MVVFDLGGVLIDWDPRHLYRKLIPDPDEMEDFLANVATGAWHGVQDRGGDPLSATRKLQAQHPGKDALITAFYDRFEEMCDHSYRPMTELVERLHEAGTPLFLLSNAPGFMDAWLRGPARQLHPFVGCFRNFVVSGHVGCTKPGIAIYELMCLTGGFAPQDAVFIDDVMANVDGARAAGMSAVHHQEAETTIRELRALGLPA